MAELAQRAGPEGGDEWHKVEVEASNYRCTPGVNAGSSPLPHLHKWSE